MKNKTIIGSTKPFREPGVLKATDKVKSVGKVLGGNPKKGTLSKKFFGCSVIKDMSNKKILDEEINSFSKLHELNDHEGAALILQNKEVFIGIWHAELRKEASIQYGYKMASLSNGAIRVRYTGSVEGYGDGTVIEFEKKDIKVISNIIEVIDNINSPADMFLLEYTGPLGYWSAKGNSSEVIEKLEKWGNPDKPSMSTSVSYWHNSNLDESKDKILEYNYNNDTPTPMIGGLELLKQINIRNSAALISADNNVYLGDEHYLLRRYFRSVGINPELQTGVVRIRFEGTEGFYNTTIEFAKKDTETIQRVFTALDYVAAPNGTYVVEYTMSNVRKDFRGTSEEIKKEIEKWLNPVAPSYSSNMNYWRTQESKKSLGRLLDEAKQKRELTKRLQEEFGKFV